MSEKTKEPTAPVAIPSLKKRGLKGFYRDVVREMKHVHWPSRQETNRLTGVVMAVCLITIGVLTALSFVFDTIFLQIFRAGGS